ncbi:MAG: peptide ABC transporter substrate-binding protein [Pelosinus sp.]|nr:peptide ABC transporter substrate-binding protein [Pelosinus sp.]
MRYVQSAAVFMLAAALFLGGCGLASKQVPQQGKETPAKHEVQQGGQVVYGSLYEPDTLNPLLSDLLPTAEVSSLIYSGLVTNNEKGEYLPDLAVDVPTMQNGGVSQDGCTITYRLRSGVTWHDGAPFSAEDVKFTWQTIMNSKVNILSRDGYDRIKAVDTPDPYTVVIKFKEYYAPYLTLFTTILPKHRLADSADINKDSFNRAPVGTGPFKLREWRMAESLILEANLGYFRGRPKLDQIIYKVIPDTNILLSQLKVGEVDIANGFPLNLLEQVKSIHGVTTLIAPTMVWEHLDFNLDNAIFQDVQVRQAISLGIDRQAIINSNLKGAASIAVGDQSPLSWAYNPALTLPARDVNAAKDLLVQAGWQQGAGGIFVKDGQKLAFSLVYPAGNPVRDNVAQTIVQELKEIGAAVEVRPLEAQTFFGDILKSRRFEAAMFAWVSGIEPDNASFWNSKSIPGHGKDGQNYPGWRNPEVDKLTLQGASTVDIEARKACYFRIQELIAQECPIIPLYFRADIDAVKDNVVNYKPNPTPAGSFWNAWQWCLTK